MARPAAGCGFAVVVLAQAAAAEQPAPAPAKGGDLELVQKLLTVRRDYQKTLEQLRMPSIFRPAT